VAAKAPKIDGFLVYPTVSLDRIVGKEAAAYLKAP
jgi:hypothetical protein